MRSSTEQKGGSPVVRDSAAPEAGAASVQDLDLKGKAP